MLRNRVTTTHFFAATAEERPAGRVLPRVIDAEYNLGATWLPLAEALEVETSGLTRVEAIEAAGAGEAGARLDVDGDTAAVVADLDRPTEDPRSEPTTAMPPVATSGGELRPRLK